MRSARDRHGPPRGDRPSGPAGHRPVLLQDVIESLQPAPGQAFIDATLGGGGYARALIERLRPGGTLLALDRDATAIERFAQEPVPPDITVMLEHTNFAQLHRAAERIGRPPNGVVFDLGLSSLQLDDPERGFSFQVDGPLDMRLDRSEPWTAADLLNRESESEVRRILKEYGQERWAARIAQRIVERRRRVPLKTTRDLVDVVAGAIPRGDLFNVEATDCICPPQAPVCLCGHQRSVRVVTRKPITPSEAEVRENPRARSAKLRVAEKL